jgi:hypothetical protein
MIRLADLVERSAETRTKICVEIYGAISAKTWVSGEGDAEGAKAPPDFNVSPVKGFFVAPPVPNRLAKGEKSLGLH